MFCQPANLLFFLSFFYHILQHTYNCSACVCVCASACVCVGYHLQTTHLFGMHINSPLYCRGTAGQTINAPTKTQPRCYEVQCVKNQATIEPEPACKFLEENPNETQVTSSQCAQNGCLKKLSLSLFLLPSY